MRLFQKVLKVPATLPTAAIDQKLFGILHVLGEAQKLNCSLYIRSRDHELPRVCVREQRCFDWRISGRPTDGSI